ncbi:MAG: glycerate kinase [Lachnospiraceae bacterium]|nr:glycerate kinase [Lachnospiraceae bacterium]
MHIVIAPDSFKGTLSSEQIIEIVSDEARRHFPDARITGIPIADGGEGTVHAVISSRGGILRNVSVKNPLFEAVDASYGILENSSGKPSVIIEMAAASGLPLLSASQRSALTTTSYGTGELIADALKQGIRHITIAIGGSATNDGGMGAMAALGFRFLDKDGKEVTPTGENLIHVSRIDTSSILPELMEDISFTVMCDVRSPFCGPYGATYTYGPQKGATKEQLDLLEQGMLHFAEVIKRDLGKDILDVEGAGAAGGLGGALCAFLGGSLKSGIQTLLELVQFETRIKDADIIISGEGCADGQSAQGKVLWGIGTSAKKLGVPVIAMVGGMRPDAKQLYDCGITAIVPALNRAMSLTEVFRHSKNLLRDAAERTFLLLKAGMALKNK